MGLKARWWSVAVLAGAVVLAACGDDSSKTTTGATTGGGNATTSAASNSGGGYYGGGTPTTKAAATTTSVAATGGTVTVAKTSLGNVVADDQGRTLYIFLKDEKNKSNCTGGCLNTWPPYTVTDIKAGAGIDASVLGSIATADGKKQLTINGAPLYHFSGDAAAGDTKGQGVGSNWYVVDATGAAIK